MSCTSRTSRTSTPRTSRTPKRDESFEVVEIAFVDDWLPGETIEQRNARIARHNEEVRERDRFLDDVTPEQEHRRGAARLAGLMAEDDLPPHRQARRQALGPTFTSGRPVRKPGRPAAKSDATLHDELAAHATAAGYELAAFTRAGLRDRRLPRFARPS